MAVFKFSIIKPLKLNISKKKLYHIKATSFEMIITEKTIILGITKPELRWFERTHTFYANGTIAFLYEVVNPWVFVRNKIFNSINQMKTMDVLTVYFIFRYFGQTNPIFWLTFDEQPISMKA